MIHFLRCAVAIGLLAAALSAYAQETNPLMLELESGFVYSGYNDVRIPGKGGTLFSLSKELHTDAAPFARARLSVTFGDHHTLSILAAPLKLNASGSVNRPIIFENATFPANTPLEGTYRFDSYRLTYRYTFVNNQKWIFGAGLTAKLRDAAISLSGGGQSATKKNTGFVPLVNFLLHYKFASDWRAVLEGDALAAPQGRAEDIFAGIRWDISDTYGLQGGYRMLEGGADNDKVYTFAMLNYAAVALVYHPSLIHY